MGGPTEIHSSGVRMCPEEDLEDPGDKRGNKHKWNQANDSSNDSKVL